MRYHPSLLRAIKEFNSGRYFEAHEHLEEALDEVEDDENIWQLFIGLIRIAVGYHKYAEGYPGGRNMLELGLETLGPLPDGCGGVALEALRKRVHHALSRPNAESERLGSEPPRITLQL